MPQLQSPHCGSPDANMGNETQARQNRHGNQNLRLLKVQSKIQDRRTRLGGTAEMTRERARTAGELPFGWSNDEINGYLATYHRSVVDIAFIRGEKPS